MTTPDPNPPSPPVVDLVRALTGDDIQGIVCSPGRLPDSERDRIRSAIAKALDVDGIAHVRFREARGEHVERPEWTDGAPSPPPPQPTDALLDQVADIIGRMHEAEGHNPSRASDGEILQRLRELVELEHRYHELRAREIPPQPDPLDKLRRYVEQCRLEYEAEHSELESGNGGAEAEDVANAFGRYEAAEHALKLAEEALAPLVAELREARARIDTLTRQRRGAIAEVARAQAQAKADREALRGLVDHVRGHNVFAWTSRYPRANAALEVDEARLAGPEQGYEVVGPRPRRFVVDGFTTKYQSEATTLEDAHNAAYLWRDQFGGEVLPLGAERPAPSAPSVERNALDEIMGGLCAQCEDERGSSSDVERAWRVHEAAEADLATLRRKAEQWDAWQEATLMSEIDAMALYRAAVPRDEWNGSLIHVPGLTALVEYVRDREHREHTENATDVFGSDERDWPSMLKEVRERLVELNVRRDEDRDLAALRADRALLRALGAARLAVDPEAVQAASEAIKNRAYEIATGRALALAAEVKP